MTDEPCCENNKNPDCCTQDEECKTNLDTCTKDEDCPNAPDEEGEDEGEEGAEAAA